MFSTALTVLGQPSAVVRLSGMTSGWVDTIADTPAGGGRMPPAYCWIPPGLSPPNEAFGGSQMPNCTSTGEVTGVTMLPIVIEPLATAPSTQPVASPPVDSCMIGLSSGQLVNGA